METDQVHVAELCATLYDGFHHNEQDTDVTIECEGQKFLCHRAVLAAGSTYFEGMFNNNGWTGNVTGSVVLAGNNMKAATLLEVLKYLYTGDATITSSNFIDLLHACNYLVVPGLEALCVQTMLQNRPEPIVDLLEVLFFAHLFCNQSLIDMLASCNMTERFKKFFETKEFLDINKDLFFTIVSKLWKSPPIMNKVLRRAIYRWKVHALEEREQDALELDEVLEPASEISLDHLIGPSHSLIEIGPDPHKTVVATPNPSLYLYSVDSNDRIRTYRYNGLNLRSKKFVLEQSFIQDSQIQALPGFASVDNVGVFNMAREMGRYCPLYPIFTQFASANICGFQYGRALACPPIMVEDTFDLCNLSNRGLYLLKCMTISDLLRPLLRNPRYDACKQEFSDDEIQRGLYFYNIELDRWFPVPAMQNEPRESCMTIGDNNMVYVINAHVYDGTPFNIGNMVQAYDHRERQWHIMPHVLHRHRIPQSCILNGSIYVSSNKYCERYDPIAARWEDVEGYQRNRVLKHRLVSYKNQIWQFWKRGERNCDFVKVYDSPTASWSNVPLENFFEEMVFGAVIW